MPVVLADAEGIQPAPVGQGDFLEELLETLDWRGGDSGDGIGTNGDKTIQAKLHDRVMAVERLLRKRACNHQ